MKELLETMAKGLVEHPEAVEVTVDEPDETGLVVYHLHVAEGHRQAGTYCQSHPRRDARCGYPG